MSHTKHIAYLRTSARHALASALLSCTSDRLCWCFCHTASNFALAAALPSPASRPRFLVAARSLLRSRELADDDDDDAASWCWFWLLLSSLTALPTATCSSCSSSGANARAPETVASATEHPSNNNNNHRRGRNIVVVVVMTTVRQNPSIALTESKQ